MQRYRNCHDAACQIWYARGMTATAYTYGTIEWLRTLHADGWELTVTENRRPGPSYVIRLVEDDFEQVELAQPGSVTVGVLAAKEPSGIFVPCGSEGEARDLLANVMEET